MGNDMDIRIKRLGENLKKYAGEMVKEKVMEGGAQITVSLSPAKKARWVKSAMERLDSLVDEAARNKIMESCSCESESNMKKGKLIYQKSQNIDDFLVELEKARIVGTKFERIDNLIYVYYDRCYCPLVRGAAEKISLTYCYCSNGYTRKMFQGILGRLVEVQLLQSIINGASECKFAVYLSPFMNRS